MIDDLKPYQEYKESGLSWLGGVPQHWTLRRIKTVLQERDARSRDGSGTLLSLTRNRGLIPHSQMTDKMHSAKTLVGYKLYRPGQIVMNRMQAWSGMFGSGAIEGLISPDYAAFDVVGNHDVRYILERLKTPDMVGQFALESKGIGSGFNRLYTDRFGPIPISLPPTDEQAAIVKFLDYANGKIERAIRAKRKLIGLLNEQKQAIIHRAVTRGLDPNVKLKPSGIPWLGDVPEHWKITRLGRLSRIFNGTTPSRAKPLYWLGGSVPWLSSSKVNEVPVRTPSELVTPTALNECNLKVVPCGSLIIGLIGQGKTRGMCSVLEIDACINQNIAAIVPTTGLKPIFLYYMLVASYSEIREVGRGGNQAAMNCEIVGRLPIADVPESEQHAICTEVQNKTSKMTSAIMRIEREIALFREYRITLTAEVVTGKLDVREAVKRLPDQADEPVPVDQSLDDLVDDEITEEVEA